MSIESARRAAARVLIFRALDGRHITGRDVASDAAEEVMGKLGADGTRRRLIAELDYYAEGHPWCAATWEAAREEYAARLDEMGCADRAAQVRGWQMPIREAAIAAE